MTYTLPRYKSYQEYLDDEQLHPEANYRLLSTGELIEVASEHEDNLWIANILILAILAAEGNQLFTLIRPGNKELQVTPIGDKWVNRKPDVMVMRSEHRKIAKKAITLEMPPPTFVAEMVSPGSESSDSYLRDYVWKRAQYEALGIPEYWIVDPHREQVTVLILMEDRYEESLYHGDTQILSSVFPRLKISAARLLNGEIESTAE